MSKINGPEVLDVVIPLSFSNLDSSSTEELAEMLRRFKKDYGYRRFLLTFPGKAWRQSGFPPESVYLETANRFCQVRKLLDDSEISLGWWITLTVRSGPTHGVTLIHKSDGTVSPDTACPLDGEFRRIFAQRTALFCSVAHPDFVLIEDDFGIGAAGEYVGCFCDAHVAEFSRRAGKEFSREELLERFLPLTEGAVLNRNLAAAKDLKKRLENFSDEDIDLFRIWWDLKKDSLVGCLAQVRKEVDKSTPEIPIGICQTAVSVVDGDNVAAEAVAAAGPNHTPFVRFHGTFYGGEDIDRATSKMFNALYCKQNIKENIRFYHESDTYPHTRFFSSASVMRSLMGTAFSYGFDASLFHAAQILDKPDEETVYSKMYSQEKYRFPAVSLRAKSCQVKGVQVLFEPFATMIEERCHTAWVKPLSQFGIPYTTEEANTVFVSGRQMLRWSDEKIRRLMSKQVFLDGEAACVLSQRGYGDLTGVDVTCADWVMDLCSREIISEKYADPGKGVGMHRSDTYAPKGRGQSFVIEMTDTACEPVTKIYSFDGKFISCGMTRFKNKLGGTVTVISQGVDGNASSSFFNYRRKRLLLKLIAAGDPDLVLLRETPRVFLIMNEAKEEKSSFTGMLTLINLSPDPCEDAELYLPEKWRDCTKFTLLDKNAQWVDCTCKRTDDGIILPFPLNYADPVYLCAEK